MEEKKIHLFVPTGVYPPDIGGPATYVPLLEKHLPQYGFVIDVLPFRTVRFLPKGLSHLVYFFMSIRRAFRADIVYAQDAVSVGVPARLAALLARRPLVVKVVGDHVWEQGKQRFNVKEELDDFAFWQMGRPYLLFLRLLQRWVLRGARRVVVPSAYLKKVVLRWGVPSERVVVVYNGIELPADIPEREEEIQHPLVVSAGRLVPWKGFDCIVKALEGTSYRAVIIGDGPERNRLEGLVILIGVSGQVTFTGVLPRAEMLSWARAADVFVLNSTYEGFPHTLIEVMALGTPVVASDIPANKEVITHGREGLLAPSGNYEKLREAIGQTLTNGEETKRRIIAARVRATEFSVEQTVDGLVQVLRAL